MNAIELTGFVDADKQLHLDAPVAISGPQRVRVIVLFDEGWDEDEWLYTLARNPAFDYLKEEAEDIYSLSDGKPFRDET